MNGNNNWNITVNYSSNDINNSIIYYSRYIGGIIMKENLINQIKEMLGPLANEILNIDSYLEYSSEEELKAIIRRIKIQNKKWQESKRGNNERSR